MSRTAGVVSAAAVAVTVGAIAWAGTPPRAPAPPEAVPRVVASTRATLSCPEAHRHRGIATSVFVVTPTSPTGTDHKAAGRGVAVLGASSGPHVLGRLSDFGRVFADELPGHRATGVRVTARGPLAAGLAAAEWSSQPNDSRGSGGGSGRGSGGDGTSGLAASWCRAPQSDWWFSGVDTSVGSTSRLVLTNPTPAIAVADLSLQGTAGPVDAVGGHGIAVAPASSTSIDLASLAPGEQAATLRVAASSGRLVAAVLTEWTEGVTSAGSEWLPPTQPPAMDVVLGSVAGGHGRQEQLVISNPGERQALVQVQVIDGAGAFVPTQLTDLRVGPGTVRIEDLTAVIGASRAAVRLSASVPVTGAVRQTSTNDGDFAVSSSSPVLDEPAVVPVIAGNDLQLTFVSDSRAGGGGKVGIETFDADGASLEQEDLQLRGLTTTAWNLGPSRLPEPSKPSGRQPGPSGEQPGPSRGTKRPPQRQPEAAYVVVTVEVDGGVSAVAHYTSRTGLAVLPLLSGVVTVTRPGVQPAR